MKNVKPLNDGKYSARCKQATMLAAVAAGHSHVFPMADLIVSDGWARFYKGGKEVWSCNPTYAAVHFEVHQV
ncbi:hypothetical protein DBB29_24990 [Pandoraea cepalis]|uniref:Uncharacterized protein n=1 Tax=Pandoraea cepalis TaxID=2508294 RepID=A0AAW7MGM0_9BURK|nr:hypothetical protein [Pandoraea cepalis]MDN4571919.1 hypothetical protein [Pandoraea cepalis]MDN4581373.1 hypothetical protein [Pandoraea cepalis]